MNFGELLVHGGYRTGGLVLCGFAQTVHMLYTCRLVGGWCTGRYQLRSRAHLNPAIRRRTLGDTLSFGLHSSTLGNFLKFLLASLSISFTAFALVWIMFLRKRLLWYIDAKKRKIIIN